MSSLSWYGRAFLALAVAGGALGVGGGARAAEGEGVDTSPRLRWQDVARSAQGGAFLPTTLSPRVGDQAVFALGMAGYDAARSLSLVSAAGEVTLTSRLALRVGAMLDNGAVAARLQPHVGVRWQLLRRTDDEGLDGAVALYYRRERYSYDEGLIQAVVAVGGGRGRLDWFANLAYGQDPEGDDRDGELRLAVLYRATERLQLGVDSRLRVDLWSSDQRRVARGESTRDLTAGPAGSFVIGTWALLVQAGVSQVKIAETRTGLIAMGGAATMF